MSNLTDEKKFPPTPGIYNVRWHMRLDENGDPDPDAWIFNGDVVGGVYKINDDLKTMTKAKFYNTFGRTTPIPDDAWCLELDDFQREKFLRNALPRPNLDALELSLWQDFVTKDCLQIKDIINLHEGDEIKIVILDRNLYDAVCDENTANTAHDAEQFFRNQTAIYKHIDGLKGILTFNWEEKVSENKFEFDIEYSPGNWYPLRNGCLPQKDPQGFATFNYLTPKSWKSFPETTGIGWRGPMLLWDKVKEKPRVWWYEQ